MRFNSLLNLTGFSGKAHGEPPASGCVTDTRMPETPAPSQGSFWANFSLTYPCQAPTPPAMPTAPVAGFHRLAAAGTALQPSSTQTSGPRSVPAAHFDDFRTCLPPI